MLRYVDNPNGSVDDIAGICSEGRNVVGLMPHPERASHELLGSSDGVALISSLLAAAGMDLPDVVAQPRARLTPAFLRVSADTPTSRHVA